MIIKSYLVFPIEGRLSELLDALNNLPACEATPSTNQEMLVLVTESEDETAESQLEATLRAIPSIQTLTLVSGHNESETAV